MPVSSQERARVSRQVLALQRIEHAGALAARRHTFRLKQQALAALRAGKLEASALKVSEQDQDGLLQLLKQAMQVAALLGWQQSIEQRRKRRVAIPVAIRADLLQDTLDNLLKGTRDWNSHEAQQFVSSVIGSKIGQSAIQLVRDATRDVQTKLRETVNELIAGGAIVKDGQEALEQRFAELGLDGSKPYRLEQIFRTQTQLAHNAAAWQDTQRPEIQEILWGYKYVTVGDDRVRPEHAAWDGVTLPKDNAFWNTHWPPNGYNCRCMAIPLYDERPIVKAKRLPDGSIAQVDPDFAYNPGQLAGSKGIIPTPKSEQDTRGDKGTKGTKDKKGGKQTIDDLREQQRKRQEAEDKLRREAQEAERKRREAEAAAEAERKRKEAEAKAQADRRKAREAYKQITDRLAVVQARITTLNRQGSLSAAESTELGQLLQDRANLVPSVQAAKQAAVAELRKDITEQVTNNQQLESVRTNVLSSPEKVKAKQDKVEAASAEVRDSARRMTELRGQIIRMREGKKKEQAKREYNELAAEHNKKFEQLKELQREAQAYAKSAAYNELQPVGSTANSKPKIDSSIADKERQKAIATGSRFVASLIPDAVVSEVSANFEDIGPVSPTATVRISSHYQSLNEVVRLEPNEPEHVVVHELGHHFEHTVGLYDAANEFRKMRVEKSGKPTRPMADIAKEYLGSPLNYDATEVGNEDDFGKAFNGNRVSAAYAGKEYQHRATEIISMGVELLYNDPVGFAERDPEYFKFIVGVLRGEIK